MCAGVRGLIVLEANINNTNLFVNSYAQVTPTHHEVCVGANISALEHAHVTPWYRTRR